MADGAWGPCRSQILSMHIYDAKKNYFKLKKDAFIMFIITKIQDGRLSIIFLFISLKVEYKGSYETF